MNQLNTLLFAVCLVFSSMVFAEPERNLSELAVADTLIGEVHSNAQHFVVIAAVKDLPSCPINQFHQWIITIKDHTGHSVYPAKIALDGGMPSHGHGLPTQPKVTQYLGDGRYLIEGMKFNMGGTWQINFHIATPTQTDIAKLTFNVDF